MNEFPESMRHHVDGAPQRGRLEGILVRPIRGGDVRLVDEWILGTLDHGAERGRRQVTLIQAEHVEVIAQFLGRAVAWTVLRRNLLISGLNLAACLHGTFAVGEAVLRGTLPCDPCENMQQALGPGGYLAMIGHGGICAEVVTPGTVRRGDELRWIG